jgi:hypothetical protein
MTAFVVATGNIGGILAPQLFHGNNLTLGYTVCASFLFVFALGLFLLRKVFVHMNNRLATRGGKDVDAFVI